MVPRNSINSSYDHVWTRVHDFFSSFMFSITSMTSNLDHPRIFQEKQNEFRGTNVLIGNFFLFFIFVMFSFTFQLQLVGGFRPRRSSGPAVVTGVASSPARYVPSLSSRTGLSISVARRFSSKVAITGDHS